MGIAQSLHQRIIPTLAANSACAIEPRWPRSFSLSSIARPANLLPQTIHGLYTAHGTVSDVSVIPRLLA